MLCRRLICGRPGLPERNLDYHTVSFNFKYFKVMELHVR